MADPRLVADIQRAEGCPTDPVSHLPVAYRDSEGNWTIGWGHLLDQSIDWAGHVITWETARTLLSSDLDARRAECEGLPEWPSLDTECRQNAVVECVFNLGLKHWTDEFPHTREAIRKQLWTQAATDLLDSPEWIKQVGQARVARLAGYLRSGSYSPPSASGPA